jgi:hypothetical protein
MSNYINKCSALLGVFMNIVTRMHGAQNIKKSTPILNCSYSLKLEILVTFLMLINELLEMGTCIVNGLSLASMSSLYQVDELQAMQFEF